MNRNLCPPQKQYMAIQQSQCLLRILAIASFERLHQTQIKEYNKKYLVTEKGTRQTPAKHSPGQQQCFAPDHMKRYAPSRPISA